MMDSEGQRTLENWTILDALGLDVPPRGETGFEELVETYRRRLEPCQAGAAIYLRGMESMAEARAAVLAVRERGSCPVMVSFRCDEEGRTAAGTHVLAAFIVMAGMGVYAFGLEPADPFEPVKAMQAAFDPSALVFSDEYYDVLGLENPRNPEA